MRARPDIFVDSWSDISTYMSSICQGDFWQLDQQMLRRGAVYVVGRNEFLRCRKLIMDNLDHCHFVFSNPAEGATTMLGQLEHYGLLGLAQQGRIGVISGADVPGIPKIFVHEHFVDKVIDMPGNIEQSLMTRDASHDPPYDFLFLNGRSRHHRKFLLLRLQQMGLLDRSLYTCLEPIPSQECFGSGNQEPYVFRLTAVGDQGLPVTLLPEHYEVPRYRNNISSMTTQTSACNVKTKLFDFQGHSEWGESYVYHAMYNDTAFSLVSETVFQGPSSFRTEKIWKPILMKHPWVAAASPGFYRDLHRLGFKTFDSLINEAFDMEYDHQTRLEKICCTVQDICSNGAKDFQNSAQDICEHNYQRMMELPREISADFPVKFCQWINYTFD